MTDKTREAYNKWLLASDVDSESEPYHATWQAYQAATAETEAEIRRWKARCIAAENGHPQVKEATAEADAKYLPVIEKLVEAADRASGWMYCEIKVKVDSNEINYNPFVQLMGALALAKPLLKKKGEV